MEAPFFYWYPFGYNAIRLQTVYMTTIHRVLLHPGFLISGAYLGLHGVVFIISLYQFGLSALLLLQPMCIFPS